MHEKTTKNLIWVCILISLSLALSGCSGKIYTKPDNGAESKNNAKPKNNAKDGVPFRIAEKQMEYFSYTSIIEKGGARTNNCSSYLLGRIVFAPSDTLYYLYYKPATFEKHTFSVTLNENGTLKSVNTTSMPTSPKEFVDAVKEIGAAISSGFSTLSVDEEELPPCTASPITIFGRCPIEDSGECIDSINRTRALFLNDG